MYSAGAFGDYTRGYIKEEKVRKYYRGGEKEVNGILGRNDQS